MNRALRTTILSACLLLCGCVVGPNFQRPALAPVSGYGVAASPRWSEGEAVPADWWRSFHSHELDALVAEALRSSPTVAAAKAALRAAKEQAAAQRGAYFPTVSLSVQPSRQRVSDPLSSPLASGATIYSLTTSQVTVGYAPDIFGANRRAVEALVAQADQQRFELEAARLTLASNVVLAAIQDASLRDQIARTQAIVQAQQAILDTLRQQQTLGQSSKADLLAQEALLAQAEAALPPLLKQLEINRDSLTALLGRSQDQPVAAKFTLLDLTLPETLPLSLPARLVEQRPDVRVAEAVLHAASAQVGVAKAARLPNIEITAAAGSTATGLSPSFGAGTGFWSVAAALTQPVFEGGALLHRERAAKAAYDQAAAQYRSTVLGAFQNVADTLHALQADAEAQRETARAAAASRASLEIARRQLSLGDVSRTAVFSTEQTALQAELSLIQAEANRYSDAVALFQALGGGWWNSAGGPDVEGHRP